MSLAQGFPSTFSDTQKTNEVLHNLDNETKKIYNDVNAIMAADGHGHTGNGSDGALIANTPSGNIVATTTQGAINELDQRKHANLLINSGFAINNGNTGAGYVSGTALTAGQYGHEMVKAGASGLTCTFTQSTGPITELTITAGTAIMPIEGINIIGGSYTLSWTGTATARFNGGTYGTSPQTATGIVAGALLTVEFSNGTLSKPKVNEGDKATPYHIEKYPDVLRDTQRYFETGIVNITNYCSVAGVSHQVSKEYLVVKRVTPTIVRLANTTATNVTSTSFTPFANDVTTFVYTVVNTAIGTFQGTSTYYANARM